MVWMKFNHVARLTAIAGLLLTTSIACQRATDSAPSDEATTAPTDSVETPDPAAPSPEATVPTEPPVDAGAGSQETAAAPPATTQADQSCSVSAFVADPDPAGLNVRSGPGSDYAAIATLPTNEPVEVSIVGAQDDWFLINEAYSQGQQELEQLGWVYAPLLGVTTTSLDINNPDAPASLYEAPDGFSNVKAEVPKYTEVSLLSCSGNWLQVQTGDTTGWLAVGDQCSNPSSTCP